MSGSNGSNSSNGLLERQHYCRNCGRWLFANCIALGTHGTIRIQCPDTDCQRMNLIRVGEPPPLRPDRDVWIAEVQRRRPRATTF